MISAGLTNWAFDGLWRDTRPLQPVFAYSMIGVAASGAEWGDLLYLLESAEG